MKTILANLKEQVQSDEMVYGPTINPDAKDWYDQTGVLLSVREAKTIIDYIEAHDKAHDKANNNSKPDLQERS